MATFPEVLLTAYVAGGLPAVKGGDLNALQLELLRAWKVLSGGDLFINEEFLGDQFNRSVFGALPPTVTLVDDSAAGASGAMQIVANSSAFPTFAPHKPVPLAANRDFKFAARVRRSGVWGTGQYVQIGLVDGGAANFTFTAQSGAPNWFATYVDTLSGTGYDVDLGVPHLTTYQNLQLIKRGPLVTWVIDGAERLTISTVNVPPNTLFNYIPQITLYRSTADVTLLCDCFKLWVERYPVSASIGGAAGGQHVENVRLVFTSAGALPKTGTFVLPFVDGNYSVIPSAVYVSSFSATPAPTFQILRSPSSFQVMPTAPFDASVDFLCFA